MLSVSIQQGLIGGWGIHIIFINFLDPSLEKKSARTKVAGSVSLGTYPFVPRLDELDFQQHKQYI